jgi:hypothetical protein
MHDTSIILISSFIQLNSKDPSNLLDDCKDLKDLAAIYSSIQLINLANQQEWTEAIVHD